jgi:signal transduction histidine kinase
LESTLTLITTAVSNHSSVESKSSSTQFDDGRSVILKFDRQGRSLISGRLASILGYPMDGVVGIRALSLVDPRDRRDAVRGFASARDASLATPPLDLRVQGDNGDWRVLETVFLPAASEPDPHVVACAIDVTENRTERARLYETVMASGCMIMVTDERGELILSNDTFTRMFPDLGLPRIDTEREAAFHAISARCLDEAAVYRHLTDLVSLPRHHTERLNLADGRTISLELIPLKDDQRTFGAAWHFHDVTSSESSTATELRAEFLSTLSHELRTPLTALLSFVDLLSARRLGPLNRDQRAATDVISRNANHLLRLVDDLLLLTMLESRQLPMRATDVDVGRLVRAAVADRELDARAGGIAIIAEIGEGPPLHGDAERLHQVVANILGNAVKFTPDQGKVDVTAEFERHHWTIKVRDTGIGIPPEDLGRVTKSFNRGANARHDGIAGSGLGLAVTRHIVELHHGALDIESILNVGTTVRVSLPVDSTSS